MSELKVDTITPSLSPRVSISPEVVVQSLDGVVNFEVTSSGHIGVYGPLHVGSFATNSAGQPGYVLTSQGPELPPVWSPSIPFGGIVIWYSSISSIPTGWALCDGRTVNGWRTPNLMDKFIVGAGSTYSVGQVGGSLTDTNTITISSQNMPAHRHRMTIAAPDDSNGLGGYGYNTNIQYLGSPHELEQKGPPDGTRTGYWNVDTGLNTDSSGSAQPITIVTNTVPPYYALCFIMRVPT
jgi:hypothetical protein